MQRLSNPSADTVPGGAPRRCEDPQPFARAEAVIEFGRFSVFLRQRRLVADGVPVKLGTRGYDLLLALLEADGALVSKEELLRRVWPGIFVAEENLKTQMSALRKALGEDCDLIRTEVGRGYRFTAEVCFKAESRPCRRPTQRRHHARRSAWRGSRRRGGGRTLRRQTRLA